MGVSSSRTGPVTVVIVNWNSGRLLSDCLRGLAGQTMQPERVVIVDNASSDGSINFGEIPLNITILRAEGNLGFAGGNNLALAECGTEFVALLNPDAFPEPDWLERLLAAASSHPSVTSFGSCQLRHGDPDILDGIGDIYHVTGMLWRDRYGARREPRDSIQREVFSPCAAAALYRLQALVDVGYFDQDYFCYVEDVDLGFRLRLAGHKALYVPHAIVHHVGSATTGGRHSDFYVYYGHRNMVWTYVKNMPSFLFWGFLPLHVMVNIAGIALHTLRGRGAIIFRSKLDAIKGVPKMWHKRRHVQELRVASMASIWQALDKRAWPRKT